MAVNQDIKKFLSSPGEAKLEDAKELVEKLCNDLPKNSTNKMISGDKDDTAIKLMAVKEGISKNLDRLKNDIKHYIDTAILVAKYGPMKRCGFETDVTDTLREVMEEKGFSIK